MSIEKFGKASYEDIINLQDTYSVTFPKDYVEFLQQYNGGVIAKTEKNNIFVEDFSAFITLDVLYGIETGSRTSDIQTWMSKFEEDLIDKAIIIGDDIMQGFIVMICEGEFEGIYYWDDSYQFEESTDEENTF